MGLSLHQIARHRVRMHHRSRITSKKIIDAGDSHRIQDVIDLYNRISRDCERTDIFRQLIDSDSRSDWSTLQEPKNAGSISSDFNDSLISLYSPFRQMSRP